MGTKPNGQAWSQIAGGPCHDCTGLGLAIDEPLAFVLSGEMAWDMLEGCAMRLSCSVSGIMTVQADAMRGDA
jgi:hypothetical protein